MEGWGQGGVWVGKGGGTLDLANSKPAMSSQLTPGLCTDREGGKGKEAGRNRQRCCEFCISTSAFLLYTGVLDSTVHSMCNRGTEHEGKRS